MVDEQQGLGEWARLLCESELMRWRSTLTSDLLACLVFRTLRFL